LFDAVRGWLARSCASAGGGCFGSVCAKFSRLMPLLRDEPTLRWLLAHELGFGLAMSCADTIVCVRRGVVVRLRPSARARALTSRPGATSENATTMTSSIARPAFTMMPHAPCDRGGGDPRSRRYFQLDRELGASKALNGAATMISVAGAVPVMCVAACAVFSCLPRADATPPTARRVRC